MDSVAYHRNYFMSLPELAPSSVQPPCLEELPLGPRFESSQQRLLLLGAAPLILGQSK